MGGGCDMAEDAPLVTIVVPAWNESANLPACLAALHATLSGSEYEIIIVDDGSTDDTRAVAHRLAAEGPTPTRVAVHEVNQGSGAALRTGFAAARAATSPAAPPISAPRPRTGRRSRLPWVKPMWSSAAERGVRATTR